MKEVSDKLLKLMRELKQATIEGKISWENTADEGQFRAVLKPGWFASVGTLPMTLMMRPQQSSPSRS